jgi:hypothetical protein
MADASTNADFYKDLGSTFGGAGWNYGYYSSPGEWSSTTGGAVLDPGRPLWAATYSYECNFSDVSLFGGWGSIAMMQYSDRGNACAIQYDINCY